MSQPAALYVDRAQVGGRFAAATRRTARVALPLYADGAMALHDARGEARVRVRLRGARPSHAEAGHGHVVYRHAIDEGHVVHRLTPAGTEDYLLLDRAPRQPIRYELELVAGVAGLRLSAATLELLDAGGAPRLRVAPPWIVGADGRRLAAALAVRGCAVDTDARAPFGRAPAPPGARRCEIEVSWDAARLTYPAVLDPSWTATADLVIGREAHTATRLPSGRVLIAGGASGDPVTLSEIYDPATDSFAAAAPTAADHVAATATVVAQGGRSLVLVAGGQSYPPALAEAYDEATGAWLPAGEMHTIRFAHTATVLPDGRVLVAGGADLFGNLVTGAELYDPATSAWALAGYLNDPRQGHVAFLAPVGGGTTLVIAGGTSAAGVLDGAEAWDPLSPAWTRLAAAALTTPRTAASAVTLPDGRVLVAGGRSGPTPLASAELFDPAAGAFAAAAAPGVARAAPLLAALDGAVLAAGGGVAEAELYDPASGSWTATTPLAVARSGATATALADGSVIVAGGRTVAGGQIQILASVERFRRGAWGAACASATECASGVCTAGACDCAPGTAWCAETASCLPAAVCCGACSDGGAAGPAADAGVPTP